MSKLSKLFLSILMIVSFSMNTIQANTANGNDRAIIANLPSDNSSQIESAGGSNPTDGSFNSDGVSISKVVTPTEYENYFDITLTVKTLKTLEQIARTQYTDIVVVFDRSNTMNAYVNKDGSASPTAACDPNNPTRLCQAKTALDSFIQGIADNNPEHVRVSVVAFNANAETIVPLTRVNTSANVQKLIDGVGNIVAPADESLKWTNIEGGLQLARNILAASRAESNHQYVILLTDGFPTTYINRTISGNASSTSKILGYNPVMGWNTSYDASKCGTTEGYFCNPYTEKVAGGGTNYSDKGALYAQNVAEGLKNDGVNIFSIGVDVDGHSIQGYWNASSGDTTIDLLPDREGQYYGEYNINDTVTGFKNWLGYKIAGGDQLFMDLFKNKTPIPVPYYDAHSDQGLVMNYQQVWQNIETLHIKEINESWIAEDPMGDDVEFQYFYDNEGKAAQSLTGSKVLNGENQAAFNQSQDIIQWELPKSGFTQTQQQITQADGKIITTTVTTYQLKYRIRLENEKNGFIENQDTNTNKTTTLKYKVSEDGVISDEKNMIFPEPAVEGYLTNLVFTKKSTAEGNPVLEGAKFTLTHNENYSICDHVEIGPFTATSDAQGLVRFENIPSGHEYTLIETESPKGYAAGESYHVIVAYDKAYIDGQEVNQDSVIYNSPEPENVHIQIYKYIAGQQMLPTDPFYFNIRLISAVDNNNTDIAQEDLPVLPANPVPNLNKDGDVDFKVDFGSLSFKVPGIYQYRIEEVDHLLWSANTYIDATITVTNEGNGALQAQVTYTDQNNEVSDDIINHYDIPDSISYSPVLYKDVTYANSNQTQPGSLDQRFTFEIEPANDTEHYSTESTFGHRLSLKDVPLPSSLSASNNLADEGKVSFGAITFTQPGIYKYWITERLDDPSWANITGDVLLTVTVEAKEQQGSQKAMLEVTDTTYTVNGTSIVTNQKPTITNEYTKPAEGSTSIQVDKEILVHKTSSTPQNAPDVILPVEGIYTFELVPLSNDAPMPIDSTTQLPYTKLTASTVYTDNTDDQVDNGISLATFSEFETIKFTDNDYGKTYTYKITEVIPEDKNPSVLYTSHAIIAEIKVGKNKSECYRPNCYLL